MASSSSKGRVPPPLPPRQESSAQLQPEYDDAPPPYEEVLANNLPEDTMWTTRDPRSSSQDSLVPSDSDEQNDRRKLLLVYIHGFMGNETSFRSFPAHVHHLLAVIMADTHVVHTKVYPRYLSKRKITFARDDFSKWLEPHEDKKTDVVLLGHSMGGLLSAEVVIMPPTSPSLRPLKHRILGSINFDVPFLGMHPGIIKSGLASIFSPPDEPKDKPHSSVASTDGTSSSATSLSGVLSPTGSDAFWDPGQNDPNYNPSFNNDVVLPIRKTWESAWHFINKHSNDLSGATKQLVSSHLEFGGTMANYGELKARYGKIRALEEESPDVRKSVAQRPGVPDRVRFINYYTASHGRTKKPKPGQEDTVTPGPESSSQLQSTTTLNLSEAPTQSTTSLNLSKAPTQSTVASEAPTRGASVDDQSLPDDRSVDDASFRTASIGEASVQSEGDDELENATESLTIMDPSPAVDADTDSEDEKARLDEHKPQLEPQPEEEKDDKAITPLSPSSTMASQITLPPIPDPPTEPAPLDVSHIDDPDTRKLVEKEHARTVKTYEKALKYREKAIQDRKKLEEKRERRAQKDVEKSKKDADKAVQKAQKAKDKAKQARQKEAQKQAKVEHKETKKQMSQMEGEELRLEQEKQRMEAEGRRMRGEPEPEKESEKQSIDDDGEISDPATSVPSLSNSSVETLDQAPSMVSSVQPEPKKKEKAKDKGPPKDRMFCMLPPADSSGQRDPCWVRIFMEGVDEVGAHCGLFFIDERYEKLVGEVADRIEGWAKEDMSERRASSYSRPEKAG